MKIKILSYAEVVGFFFPLYYHLSISIFFFEEENIMWYEMYGPPLPPVRFITWISAGARAMFAVGGVVSVTSIF